MKYTITCASLALLSLTAIGPAAVIVDQTSGSIAPQIGSQVFPNVPNSSQFAFDDFSIATPFSITTFTAFVGAHTGSAATNVSVVAGIYAAADANTAPILSTIGTQVGFDLQFDFGGATLPAGHYWINAHIVRPSSGGVWQWDMRQPISGSEAVWHNPGGGAGLGTNPLTLGNVIEQADLRFVLNGNAVPEPSAAVLGLVGVFALVSRGIRNGRNA